MTFSTDKSTKTWTGVIPKGQNSKSLVTLRIFLSSPIKAALKAPWKSKTCRHYSMSRDATYSMLNGSIIKFEFSRKLAPLQVGVKSSKKGTPTLFCAARVAQIQRETFSGWAIFAEFAACCWQFWKLCELTTLSPGEKGHEVTRQERWVSYPWDNYTCLEGLNVS